MKTLTVCLGFSHNAEEAVNTYVALFDSVFGNSKVLPMTRFSGKEFRGVTESARIEESMIKYDVNTPCVRKS